MNKSKKSSYKPTIFIGSSSEGIELARLVKKLLAEDTIPTLWEDDLFLPGTITLQVLENQLEKHSFALLLATPDDLLVKREVVASTLRDNVLFECGLFMGALGRRRTFLLAPKYTPIQLPTDLSGLSIARYDSAHPDPAESLKVPIENIVLAIRAEWRRIQRASVEFARNELLGEQHRALTQLLRLSERLLDLLVHLPNKAIAGLHDQQAFAQSKYEIIRQLEETAETWEEFAMVLDIEKEYVSLLKSFKSAVMRMPYYLDIEIAEEPRITIRDIPMLRRIKPWLRRQRLWANDVDYFLRRMEEFSPGAAKDMRKYFKGRASLEELEAGEEIGQSLRVLSAGLEKWWATQGANLIDPLIAFQRKLIEMLQAMLYAYLKA